MATTQKTKKPYKLLAITKDNGDVINVGRTPLVNLETLIEVQDRLLGQFLELDGSMGELLMNEQNRADLATLCSLLPIVGTDKFLELEDIEENWEQLIVLFFHGGFDMENRKLGQVEPSKVSQLHFLRYSEMLMKHLERLKPEKFKEN